MEGAGAQRLSPRLWAENNRRKLKLVGLAYGSNQMGINLKKSSTEEKVKNKHDYLDLLKINGDIITDPLFLKGRVSEQSVMTQCPPPKLCTLILSNICPKHPRPHRFR